MKNLIIYFSHTGENYMEDGIRNIDKGNTEIVVDELSKLTNASIFKVEPKIPYPYNYHECCNVAKKELDEHKKIELVSKLDNIDQYDVIYIGGPVWYGHYPMALLSALDGLNFNSKIVKPFTTHEGSGLGSTAIDLKNICIGANIKAGMPILGSRASLCGEKLKEWMEE